tara:strand:+ start:730 stop:1221 length:492 start_codon:yes stop_codon:yes gene_type:complete
MRKKINIIISCVLLLFVFACAGYKPIFSQSNLQFSIVDYTLHGDKKLSDKLYSKLQVLSQSNKNSSDIKNIKLRIDITKDKRGTSKDTTGKVLEYNVRLISKVLVNDILTGDEILNYEITDSVSYKVQDRYSETLRIENESTNNLIDKTYQGLLVKLAEAFQK